MSENPRFILQNNRMMHVGSSEPVNDQPVPGGRAGLSLPHWAVVSLGCVDGDGAKLSIMKHWAVVSLGCVDGDGAKLSIMKHWVMVSLSSGWKPLTAGTHTSLKPCATGGGGCT